jgi:hypothetical protein
MVSLTSRDYSPYLKVEEAEEMVYLLSVGRNYQPHFLLKRRSTLLPA